MFAEGQLDLCFPQQGNISCRKPLTEDLIYFVVFSLTSVVIVLLNLFVIVSLLHFRQLHTPTNYLLLSLAVSDCLVGLEILPVGMYRLTFCWYLGDRLCSLYNYTVLIITSASVGNMLLISIDRYVAICDPLHYNTKVTVKRIHCCVSLCWILSVAYCGFIFSSELSQPGKSKSCNGECVIFLDHQKGVLDVIATFILPLSIIIMLYTRVFVVAVSQARAMRSHVIHGKQQRAKRSELKAARMLGFLVLIFIVCFCPYFVVSVGSNVHPNDVINITTLYLYQVNSLLNPLIYAFFYPCFRNAFKHILTLRILQPGSCDFNIL
ncbi:trace amine-associated receptor 1-like [Stigmatopora argus]